MKVRDYLAIPYIVEASPVERSDGEWMRRLRYPELGDFSVETYDVETGLNALEAWRIQEIVRLLRAGETPPTPRPPLHNADPEWLARSLGLWPLIDEIYDLDAARVALRG